MLAVNDLRQPFSFFRIKIVNIKIKQKINNANDMYLFKLNLEHTNINCSIVLAPTKRCKGPQEIMIAEQTCG